MQGGPHTTAAAFWAGRQLKVVPTDGIWRGFQGLASPVAPVAAGGRFSVFWGRLLTLLHAPHHTGATAEAQELSELEAARASGVRYRHPLTQELDLPDIAFFARFDGNDRVSFVQGEDREVVVTLRDMASDTPLSLLGCSVSLHLPRAGEQGGSIKRRTTPLSVVYPGTAGPVALTLFPATSHGLVSGDVVQVMSLNAAGLPAPLLPSTNYVVSASDNDHFGLLLNGAQVVVTEPLAGGFLLSVVGAATADGATDGVVVFTLSSFVTEATAAGVGKPLQLNYTDALGLTRIYLLPHALDVQAQALA